MAQAQSSHFLPEKSQTDFVMDDYRARYVHFKAKQKTMTPFKKSQPSKFTESIRLSEQKPSHQAALLNKRSSSIGAGSAESLVDFQSVAHKTRQSPARRSTT